MYGSQRLKKEFIHLKFLPHSTYKISLLCILLYIFFDQKLVIRDLINILNTKKFKFSFNLWSLVVIFIHNFRGRERVISSGDLFLQLRLPSYSSRNNHKIWFMYPIYGLSQLLLYWLIRLGWHAISWRFKSEESSW